MISERSLAGYALEELLARELRDSGFRLLRARRDDPDVLREQGNGLAILGRGGVHQADVLGELIARPRFMHPIRLFVEAKHRPDTRVGIETVRNAVGVLSDIHEHYTSAHARRRRQRYSYRYAIFSSGGFSATAVDYATTHDISPIDLSKPGWKDFTQRASDIAEEALRVARRARRVTFPVNDFRQLMRSALLDKDRSAVRTRLNSFAAGDAAAGRDLGRLVEDLMSDWPGQVTLVSAQTSLFTVTHVDDDAELRRLAEGKAILQYDKRAGEGTWVLTSALGRRKGLPLALPPRLEEEFLGASSDKRREDRGSQLEFLTDGPDVISIEIDEAPSGDSTASTWQKARNDFEVESTFLSEWSAEPARLFMSRLATTKPKLAELVTMAVIRAGAGTFGSISREEVYEVMDYDEDRSLRGFTKPIRTLLLQMVDLGEVAGEVEWPLYAWYETGKRATEFRVPADFVAALA